MSEGRGGGSTLGADASPQHRSSTTPSWGWGWWCSYTEGSPGPQKSLELCKQINVRTLAPLPCTTSCRPQELELHGHLTESKAALVSKTLWEIFVLDQQLKLLRVVKRQWTRSSLGWQGCPWVMHILLWVRLLPPLCQGKLGTNLLGGSFPSWGLFPHGCLQSSSCWWLPKLLSPHKVRGKLPPCTPLAAASSPTLLVGQHTAGTQSWRCFLPLLPLASAGGLCLPAAQLLVVKTFLGSSVPLPWYFTWIYPTTIPLVPGWGVPSLHLMLSSRMGGFLKAKVIASLVPWAVPGDSTHALHAALAGWALSSCWKSCERPEIFHSLGPLPFSLRPFFPRCSQFWAVVSCAVSLLWRGRWTCPCPMCCPVTVVQAVV